MGSRRLSVLLIGLWKDSLWLQVWCWIKSGAVEGKIGIIGLHDGCDVQEDLLLDVEIFLPNRGFGKAINLQIQG